jgi:hypothetical protein
MITCCIDHITVTAPTLQAGADFVRQQLGVTPQPGGSHPRMGTHNLLLRLGDGLFLEVIAPDPLAPAPGRPRWFGLDRMTAKTLPGLATWVVRTDDIQGASTLCPEPLGAIEPMSRGSLNWYITIPADGTVPLDGVAPALIEWQTDVHPAATLEDVGISLVQLEIFHPAPQRLTRLLSAIGATGPIVVSTLPDGGVPHLVATLSTPHGPRLLSTPATERKNNE